MTNAVDAIHPAWYVETGVLPVYQFSLDGIIDELIHSQARTPPSQGPEPGLD